MLFAPDWDRDTAHLGASEPAPAREMFARWAADLVARGAIDEAAERARVGTEQFPQYATGWFLRAQAELEQGHLDRAAGSVERCLALESEFYAAWELLAHVRVLQERPAAAKAARMRLAELAAPSQPDADDTTCEGNSASEPKRKLVVRKHPDASAFETPTLAEVYRRQGLLDRALAVYNRILERHPDDSGARAMVRKIESELAVRGRPAEPS
jgi:tetratricopeptide (TPR) repeat protein